MNNLIEYLKGPELVVRFQEYFGIEYVDEWQSQHSERQHLTKNVRNKSIDKEQEDASYDGGSPKKPQQNNCDKNLKNAKLEKAQSIRTFRICNKFWYYLFVIGTELGDELFYASFIPFWFWNIDGAVGRRVIFLWSCVMYIGQGLKDIIKWPRPGLPAMKLQEKWSIEYGMPSTHAMVGLSIPFSVLIFTNQRYLYPVEIGIIISTIWCGIVCLSRIYLGMHSVLDVIVGVLLTIFLMIILVPLVDFLDFYILTSMYSPIIILFVSIMLIYCYPKSDKWTPTRGDTAMTVSVCVGLQIGTWLNYQLGNMIPPSTSPPYEVIWPNYQMFGLLLLRTVLGLCCIFATRALCKTISYAFVCAIIGKDANSIRNSKNSLQNTQKTIVDLCYKYFTCGMIGFNTCYLLPNAFKLIGIGRPDFYTEI